MSVRRPTLPAAIRPHADAVVRALTPGQGGQAQTVLNGLYDVMTIGPIPTAIVPGAKPLAQQIDPAKLSRAERLVLDGLGWVQEKLGIEPKQDQKLIVAPQAVPKKQDEIFEIVWRLPEINRLGIGPEELEILFARYEMERYEAETSPSTRNPAVTASLRRKACEAERDEVVSRLCGKAEELRKENKRSPVWKEYLEDAGRAVAVYDRLIDGEKIHGSDYDSLVKFRAKGFPYEIDWRDPSLDTARLDSWYEGRRPLRESGLTVVEPKTQATVAARGERFAQALPRYLAAHREGLDARDVVMARGIAGDKIKKLPPLPKTAPALKPLTEEKFARLKSEDGIPDARADEILSPERGFVEAETSWLDARELKAKQEQARRNFREMFHYGIVLRREQGRYGRGEDADKVIWDNVYLALPKNLQKLLVEVPKDRVGGPKARSEFLDLIVPNPYRIALLAGWVEADRIERNADVGRPFVIFSSTMSERPLSLADYIEDKKKPIVKTLFQLVLGKEKPDKTDVEKLVTEKAYRPNTAVDRLQVEPPTFITRTKIAQHIVYLTELFVDPDGCNLDLEGKDEHGFRWMTQHQRAEFGIICRKRADTHLKYLSMISVPELESYLNAEEGTPEAETARKWKALHPKNLAASVEDLINRYEENGRSFTGMTELDERAVVELAQKNRGERAHLPLRESLGICELHDDRKGNCEEAMRNGPITVVQPQTYTSPVGRLFVVSPFEKDVAARVREGWSDQPVAIERARRRHSLEGRHVVFVREEREPGNDLVRLFPVPVKFGFHHVEAEWLGEQATAERAVERMEELVSQKAGEQRARHAAAREELTRLFYRNFGRTDVPGLPPQGIDPVEYRRVLVILDPARTPEVADAEDLDAVSRVIQALPSSRVAERSQALAQFGLLSDRRFVAMVQGAENGGNEVVEDLIGAALRWIDRQQAPDDEKPLKAHRQRSGKRIGIDLAKTAAYVAREAVVPESIGGKLALAARVAAHLPTLWRAGGAAKDLLKWRPSDAAHLAEIIPLHYASRLAEQVYERSLTFRHERWEDAEEAYQMALGREQRAERTGGADLPEAVGARQQAETACDKAHEDYQKLEGRKDEIRAALTAKAKLAVQAGGGMATVMMTAGQFVAACKHLKATGGELFETSENLALILGTLKEMAQTWVQGHIQEVVAARAASGYQYPDDLSRLNKFDAETSEQTIKVYIFLDVMRDLFGADSEIGKFIRGTMSSLYDKGYKVWMAEVVTYPALVQAAADERAVRIAKHLLHHAPDAARLAMELGVEEFLGLDPDAARDHFNRLAVGVWINVVAAQPSRERGRADKEIRKLVGDVHRRYFDQVLVTEEGGVKKIDVQVDPNCLRKYISSLRGEKDDAGRLLFGHEGDRILSQLHGNVDDERRRNFDPFRFAWRTLKSEERAREIAERAVALFGPTRSLRVAQYILWESVRERAATSDRPVPELTRAQLLAMAEVDRSFGYERVRIG